MTTPAQAGTKSIEPKSEKDRVVIFDTTLRDGEQSPGATMTHEEKLEVAELLDEMGVDVIEADVAIASDGDFAAVHGCAKRAKNAVICGLLRAAFKDIDRCAEAIKPAERKRIHTFLYLAGAHEIQAPEGTASEVFEMVIQHAGDARARNHTDDVEWSSEDGTRTEFDFLCRCVEAAIKTGATTINIPDTSGYTRCRRNISRCSSACGNACRKISDLARFSVHCHDDLGMAVGEFARPRARQRARQIECTINGAGERAGNASLEEVGSGDGKCRGTTFCRSGPASIRPC